MRRLLTLSTKWRRSVKHVCMCCSAEQILMVTATCFTERSLLPISTAATYECPLLEKSTLSQIMQGHTKSNCTPIGI